MSYTAVGHVELQVSPLRTRVKPKHTRPDVAARFLSGGLAQ
jgi:hypothetical protein